MRSRGQTKGQYVQITTRVRQQCVNIASTVRQQQIQGSVDTCVNSRISGVLTHMSASTVDMSASTLIRRACVRASRGLAPARARLRRTGIDAPESTEARREDPVGASPLAAPNSMKLVRRSLSGWVAVSTSHSTYAAVLSYRATEGSPWH